MDDAKLVDRVNQRNAFERERAGRAGTAGEARSLPG